MKRKKVVTVPAPEDMSVADALTVMQQTIVVSCVMLKEIDPNEAYDEWQATKDQILACVQITNAILQQYGDQFDLLRITLPAGVGMGGYRVDDLDLEGAHDELPF